MKLYIGTPFPDTTYKVLLFDLGTNPWINGVIRLPHINRELYSYDSVYYFQYDLPMLEEL